MREGTDATASLSEFPQTSATADITSKNKNAVRAGSRGQHPRHRAVTRPRLHHCPVPVSPTVCGLFAALSRIVRVAERAPVRVGENVTLIVQFAAAVRPAPSIGQLL